MKENNINQIRDEFHEVLDKKIEESKIEKARKEAERINNYNKWKNEHDRLVNKELRKLERKNKPKIRRDQNKIPVILKIAFTFLILLELLKKYPQIGSWLMNLFQ